MYWDSTGDWRSTYYKELHERDEHNLSFVEKFERDLDLLELNSTIKLLEKTDITEVLDIGCGTGRQILHYCSLYPNKHFTGVDISEHQIQLFQTIIYSKNLSNITAVQMDATNVNNLNKQYNLITFYNNSFGCLTEKQQKECLKNIFKIIAPKGYLLIGCFDRIDLAVKCYQEWNLPIVALDINTGVVDLGVYKSCWKTHKLFLPILNTSSFHCCSKKSDGLGSVYIFQNNR